MTLKEIIQQLAQPGWRIIVDSDGCYIEYELRGPGQSVLSEMIRQLGREGWIESAANGGSYHLSDAGRLAYLKSTDELGDGKLIAPLGLEEPSR